jgi:hypothetical protein
MAGELQDDGGPRTSYSSAMSPPPLPTSDLEDGAPLLPMLVEVIPTSDLEPGRSLLRYSLFPFLRWVDRRLPSFLLLGVVFALGRPREVEYFGNNVLPAEYFGQPRPLGVPDHRGNYHDGDGVATATKRRQWSDTR